MSQSELQFYDPSLEIRVSADDSGYGLEAVREYKNIGAWRPTQYSGKTLTDSVRYAQIEKEALALS